MITSGEYSPHFGFEVDCAEESINLSRTYAKTVKRIKRKLDLCTSTPLSKFRIDKMADSFNKFQNCISKCDDLCDVVVDSDSGYVSHTQESNSNMTFENSGPCWYSTSKPVFISEDALLEKPNISTKNEVKEKEESAVEDEEYSHLFYLSNSTVCASFESEKTRYSGFEEDESVVSDLSGVIAAIPPIKMTESLNITTGSDMEIDTSLDHSKNTQIVENFTDVNINVDYRDISLDNSLMQMGDISNSNVNVHVSPKIVEKENVGYTSNVGVDAESLKHPDLVSRLERDLIATTPEEDPVSPDIFSEEECEDTSFELTANLRQNVAQEKYVISKDQTLIKRVNEGLNGVFPPTSLTIVHFSAEEILARIEDNKHLFLESDDQVPKENKSLLLTTDKLESVSQEWPAVLEARYHGLHHNRSKLSEEFEQLCLKYGQRYVGAETLSTCSVFETKAGSPSKRKSTKLRWNVKSPGRRLSHLARRRITFSNPALQFSGSSSVCSRARQILVDARKLELLNRRKSPRKRSPRKTPRKSPRVKGRTPTSSTRKRRALEFRMISEDEYSVPSTSSCGSFRASITKRALFQSPEKVPSSSGLGNASKKSAQKRASFISPDKISGGVGGVLKKLTPKRALFISPEKGSPSKRGSVFDRKRKRSESEQEHPSKFSRSSSMDARPSGSEVLKPTLQRQSSGSNHGMELSAHHKKKLQWAVYEALRSRNISVSHPQFKVFASVLARVTRRFLPNLSANTPRPEGGTSERMLKIARQHVLAVTKGKTVDEILQEVKLNSSKPKKLTGYVSKEEAERMDISGVRNKENVLQDKSNLIHKRAREEVLKPRPTRGENNVDRIRKVIDFGDDPADGCVR